MNLPACTTLTWDSPGILVPFISCPKIQHLTWLRMDDNITPDEAVLKSLCGFLFNCPCLQVLRICIHHSSGSDSLIHIVFCDAREQGVWQDIRGVEVEVRFHSSDAKNQSFSQMVGQQHYYGKQWKKFEVTTKQVLWPQFVLLRASM